MDKLTEPQVLSMMLPLLEEGTFSIRVPGPAGGDGPIPKTVNTRKLVIRAFFVKSPAAHAPLFTNLPPSHPFMLQRPVCTTNWGQASVLEWFKTRQALVDARAPGEHPNGGFSFFTTAHATWLVDTLGAQIKKEVRAALGAKDALVSRVDAFIPFLPFSHEEKLVVAEMQLQQLAVVLAKGASLTTPAERMQHDLTLRWDKDVVQVRGGRPGLPCLPTAMLMNSHASFPPPLARSFSDRHLFRLLRTRMTRWMARAPSAPPWQSATSTLRGCLARKPPRREGTFCSPRTR